MNAEEFIKLNLKNHKSTGSPYLFVEDAFEALRLARQEEKRIAGVRYADFDYLTEKEKQMPDNMKLLQYSLGIESCKTKGEVVEILKEIQRDEHKRVLLEVKEWLENSSDDFRFAKNLRIINLKAFDERFLKKEGKRND